MDDLELLGDLNAQDDDGFGWSTLADATAPETARPGAMLLAGNSQAQAVVRVVAVDDDGQIHFRSCPDPSPRTATCSTGPWHDGPGRLLHFFYTLRSDGVVRSGMVWECSGTKVQLRATMWDAVV